MPHLILIALIVALIFTAAFAQEKLHHTIDLEFVVLIGALDSKPIYVNPRAVTYIAPHDDGITRIGFIGGDVKSVLGGVEPIALKLIEPPALKR